MLKAVAVGTLMGVLGMGNAVEGQAVFGPANPFYKASTLSYEAPPFDRIKDADYQPAIEAGMEEQRREIRAIADNPAAPTFDNTLVAMEKTGVLLSRASQVFDTVTGANINLTLQAAQDALAPKRAAHRDAIYLDAKLFGRVKTVYGQRASLGLSPDGLRLVEVTYRDFVHAGANLNDADKARLKKLNEEESTLSNVFVTKLLAATKAGAYETADREALAGLPEAQIAAAVETAKERGGKGFALALQNTTQQPALQSLSVRTTRAAVFEHSWNRAERGGENDTRATCARLAQLRAEKGKLLGFANYAAWSLDDQMAKTPAAALKFMDALVPAATAKAMGEVAENQAVVDAQGGGFKLTAADWNFYSEQVRKAKFALDEAQVKPYFELHNCARKRGLLRGASALRSGPSRSGRICRCGSRMFGCYEVFDASRQGAGAVLPGPLQARQQERRRVGKRAGFSQSKLLGRAAGCVQRDEFCEACGGRAGADLVR